MSSSGLLEFGSRKFTLISNTCIKCSEPCLNSIEGGYAVPTINPVRINLLGIDDNYAMGFIHYCLAGENTTTSKQDEFLHPELKQPNGVPRVCLNHLPPKGIVIELETGLEFTSTTSPDKA